MGKILLIEDESIQVELIKRLLEPRGHVVLTVRNGQEGIEVASREKPQLILMDMIIPGMHGLEATIKLKEEPATREIPIIALTVMSSPNFVQECYRVGVAGYIKKPFDPKTLLESVERIVGQPEKKAGRILIVAGISRLATMIEMRLLRQGYDVMVLGAGEISSSHLEGKETAAVFVDVSLPDAQVASVLDTRRAGGRGKGPPAVAFGAGPSKDVLSRSAARHGIRFQLTDAGELGALLDKISQSVSR
jgi:CheY-like chemotaxis protein